MRVVYFIKLFERKEECVLKAKPDQEQMPETPNRDPSTDAIDYPQSPEGGREEESSAMESELF
ncbi:MAG: hypothetical protein V1696_01235 [Candidatus Jorgensenbacteria bacterium]